MEIGIREMLIFLGVLIIVAIFIDGYRRVRDNRRSHLGFKLDQQGEAESPIDPYSSELPSGKARIAGQDTNPVRKVKPSLLNTNEIKQEFSPNPSNNAHQASFGENSHAEKTQAENAMPRDYLAARRGSKSAQEAASVRGHELSASESSQGHSAHLATQKTAGVLTQEPYEQAPNSSIEPSESFDSTEKKVSKSAEQTDQQVLAYSQASVDSSSGYKPNSDTLHKPENQKPDLNESDLNKAHLNQTKLRETAQPERAASSQAQTGYTNNSDMNNRSDRFTTEKPAASESKPLREVLIINILGKKGDKIPGDKLMQTVLALGMRYGKMNIFHRFERPEEKKGLLFSLANLVEPGNFDLDTMASFETPGICLFLSLPGPQRSLYAFDLLIDTARKLVHTLDAEMRDDNQSVITPQTIEHYRQRVMEFERRQKMTHRLEPSV